MKKICAFLSCLIILGTSYANDKKIVPSTISKVTVYAQGAQIYRTSNYSVGKGVSEIIIEGISSSIDAKSLQVKASGNIILLDSKYSVYYPENNPQPLEGLPLKIRQQINALNDSIEEVNYDLLNIQDEIDMLTASKSILANNGAIRGNGKVNDSIPLLKEALDFYIIKMTELNKRLQQLNRTKKETNETKRGMNTRLTNLKKHQNSAGVTPKPQGPIHRIVVTVSSKEYTKGKLNVSYLVSNAGWTPLYDLRSEVSNKSVNLNYKAQVHQNTGVDWKDVKLSISTNNPYQNKTKPTLHPWYIDYYAYQKNYKDRGRNDHLSKKVKAYGFTQPATQAVEEDAETLDFNYDAKLSSNFVNVVDYLISAEFRIDLPYTIESNNEQHMVLVKNVDLNADFNYYTAPKYDKSAYLVAQISKLDELQLVPAKANIFFEGSYIGETYLDPTTMNDTLELSLGKDPNIIVKRTLLQKECKDKVIGTKKERTYAYAIEVKNLKSSSIDIIVQDQIPITQNADIEIETIELNKGKLTPRTGIVEWRYTIKPKGKKDIQLKYQVKHDKEQHVLIN